MKLGPDTGRREKTVMMEIFHLMLFLCEADVVRQGAQCTATSLHGDCSGYSSGEKETHMSAHTGIHGGDLVAR